jgi:uncharacterized protein YaaW (UPF0174 family)
MKKNTQSESANLRQQAEELLSKGLKKSIEQLSEAEIYKLIHELEVHQIESLTAAKLNRHFSATSTFPKGGSITTKSPSFKPSSTITNSSFSKPVLICCFLMASSVFR